MRCPSCEHVVYPKIKPAVIVGVIHEGKLLTSRYAGRAYGGLALIAGFVEIGETGEDTVRREVMEEVGLKVKNITYFATQPWGFESDLLLGYFCEVDGDPCGSQGACHSRMDGCGDAPKRGTSNHYPNGNDDGYLS